MADTTGIIILQVATDSIHPYIVADYTMAGVGAGGSSTGLVALELPGLSTARSTYRQPTRTILSGATSYAIELVGLGVHSNSTDLTVKFLNIDDFSKVGTIHQVYEFDTTATVTYSYNISRAIMINQDSPQQGRPYVAFTNNDGGNATGTVTIRLIYHMIQDKPFS